MKCNYSKFLNKYLDNELDRKERSSLEEHFKVCATCNAELKTISLLKGSLAGNKINSNAESFWQSLKSRIDESSVVKEREESFTLDFSNLTRRLIPVPVVFALVAIILINLTPVNSNLVDEYIFGASFDSASSLIIESGTQSGIEALVY